MPNIKSAVKRVKVSEKKTLRNNMIKSATKTAIKKYEEANENKDPNTVELLNAAKKQIDHACSKGVIKKNTASRKKSRLDKKLAVEKTAAKKAAPKATKTEKAEKTEKPKTAKKESAKKADKE
jgi:small subunit ribosomal protein S20